MTGLLVAMVIAIPGFTVGQLFSILGIGSVAIGFAFRDILQNFLAGILILLNQPFRIGDQIIMKDLEGTVEEIQTRATFLKTYDGRRVVVPNSDLFTNTVTVNTAFETRRLEHVIGISYDDDIETAIRGFGSRDARGAQRFGLARTGCVSWWISPNRRSTSRCFGGSTRPTKRMWFSVAARSCAKRAARLDEAGITIPFPIRTLDFGLAREQRNGADGNRLLADWLGRKDQNGAQNGTLNEPDQASLEHP